ncbi:MAGE-domain-containing protein [Pleomassaria siparia CBS 279.74]|uniref:MAGE-domain-containing protein n=1 Tax=Pleomassaria siparia CBS 279.74 TaxID=1314801 RepID=A0A6G1K7C0_9PLEO|nr:MAGE-domain-containing protein [Pleomassaria siparia CBS 279.74]
MPPRSSRKRRAVDDDDEDDVPTPTHTQTQRHRARDSSADAEADEDHQDGAGSMSQLSKSLVRYALACEYSRMPIKRPDITSKVMGLHKKVPFKQLFDHANSQLMDTFGMEMIELPTKEKVTVKHRRAQQLSESQTTKSKQWILRSTLPAEFRTSDILGPAQIPTSDDESAYVGLYTLIITLIQLAGGRLMESKLDRHLKRMNADDSTPVGTKEMLLARMIKDGYIVKIKDSSSGEDVIDYMVGPRGKVEVGEGGVANFVRMMYGDAATADLEQRLARSLGISAEEDHAAERVMNGDAATQRQDAGRPRHSRRRAATDSDDD